jgi:sugar/nucleoside kinase (ribokinase family)
MGDCLMADTQSIVGIGRPRVELLGTMRRFPDLGSKAELQQFSIQGGGAAATALIALLEWSYKCRLIAKVSNDPFGQLIRGGFDLPGFDTDGIVIEPDRISPFAFVALQQGQTMKRAVFQTLGNVSPLEADEVQLDRIDGCAALLIDGTEPEAQLAATAYARERSIPVTLHLNRPVERLDELIAGCDVLIASERVTADIAPRGTVDDSLRVMVKRGPRVAVITMGQEGSIGIEGDEIVRQPIFADITPLERGGAGHIYFAGFVHATVEGCSLQRRLQLASAAAGLSCRHIGAWAGVPSLEETIALAWPDGR